MRKLNVKKFVRSVLLVLAIIGCMSLLVMNSSLSYKETEYTTIRVHSGDTLWSIAKELQSDNEYYNGKDVRDIIEDLTQINKLESKTLFAEQELKIPVL